MAGNLLIDGDIMAQAREFALKSDPGRIIRPRLDRIKRCPALWVGVVMVIRVVAGAALIVPAGCRVNQSRAVQLFDALSNADFRERRCTQLAPAFVVNDLFSEYGQLVTIWDIDAGTAGEMLAKRTQVTMQV